MPRHALADSASGQVGDADNGEEERQPLLVLLLQPGLLLLPQPLLGLAAGRGALGVLAVAAALDALVAAAVGVLADPLEDHAHAPLDLLSIEVAHG